MFLVKTISVSLQGEVWTCSFSDYFINIHHRAAVMHYVVLLNYYY